MSQVGAGGSLLRTGQSAVLGDPPLPGLESHRLSQVEVLVAQVEALDRQLEHKNDELGFVTEVIADKKRQHEQLREHYAKSIQAITRQARRQRGRKGAQRVAGSDAVAIDASLLPSPSATPAVRLCDVEAHLDVAALDRALGAERWKHLLWTGKEASNGPESNCDALGPDQLKASDVATNLEGVCGILQGKLDAVNRLKDKIAKYGYMVEASGGNRRKDDGRALSSDGNIYVEDCRTAEYATEELLSNCRTRLAAEASVLLYNARSYEVALCTPPLCPNPSPPELVGTLSPTVLPTAA